MQDIGVFHSLGALWLRVLNELETGGTEAVYTALRMNLSRYSEREMRSGKRSIM